MFASYLEIIFLEALEYLPFFIKMWKYDVSTTPFSKNIHHAICENYMENVELMSEKCDKSFAAISAVAFELSRKYGRMVESAPQTSAC